MVSDYKERKKEVLSTYHTFETLIAELQAYAVKIGLPDPLEKVSRVLTEIREKSERIKADRFSLMVAGEAKSGKSTFINAYLGVELLPMDVKQCTRSIVEIQYGEALSLRATYADGRQKEITDSASVHAFLKESAALEDAYRSIPVPTIDSEILVKAGRRALKKKCPIHISQQEIEDMLKSPVVQMANIHHLPEKEYNEKIKAYIASRQRDWQEIVTKIEVRYPFKGDLHGIDIIDSPGVCARGGVSDIALEYIKKADALIFLKPLTGQALESAAFNQFMELAREAHGNGTIFLVLTRAAALPRADLCRLEEEAYKQFSHLDKRHILLVDSKAELYAKDFANVDNIAEEINRRIEQGILDSFVVQAFWAANKGGGGSAAQNFIAYLRKQSRFQSLNIALDHFGRRAHYLSCAEFLRAINAVYEKLGEDVKSQIDLLGDKAKDPKELAKKIAVIKGELDILQNKLCRGVDHVVQQFRGEEGRIRQVAEKAKKDFVDEVNKIAPSARDAFKRLERASMEKIHQFEALTKQVQIQAVIEFDQTLMKLSDKKTISWISLKPDFTETMFEKIKKEAEEKAKTIEFYTTGCCLWKKRHTREKYSKNEHFNLVRKAILQRVGPIKNDMTENLEDFVEHIRNTYIDELAKNVDAKKQEMDSIMAAKVEAEQIQMIIEVLTDQGKRLALARTELQKIQGGIEKYVQRRNNT